MMPLLRHSILLGIAVILSVNFWLTTKCLADPDTLLDRPAYLISQKRFVDAADWVANSSNPNDLKTLCARATLELYIGQVGPARLTFNEIEARTPASEPLADYGLALCDMESANSSAASQILAESAKETPEGKEADVIATARIVIALSSNDSSQAYVLNAYRESPILDATHAIQTLTTGTIADQLAVLQSPPWWLPGGVPRVVEYPGILAAGAAMSNYHGPIAIGSLSATTVGDRVTQRLSGPVQQKSDNAAKSVSGVVSVTPTESFDWNDPNWISSYSVDGRVEDVENTARRAWTWDTQSVANGLHVVAISLDNNALNQHLSESIYYHVANRRTHSIADTISQPRPAGISPEDQIVIADSWQLLTLQPCYQPAELSLAKACRDRHLDNLALLHEGIAAALDQSKSAEQIREISRAYAGRIPAWFKLPPGSHTVAKGTTHSGNPGISQGLWRGTTAKREIALTFDDGPSSDKTPPMLDALESVHCPATFMVVGIRAELVPDILRRMVADGDEVEDHTYTHPNLDEATPEHIYEEILRDAAIIQACTGVWPHFLRPPGGQSNPDVLAIAQKLGLTGALWTIDTLPAEDTGSPEAVTRLVLKKAVPGAIVLMHNGTYASTKAIPEMVAALRARGYKLVTLLQIAKDTPGANP